MRTILALAVLAAALALFPGCTKNSAADQIVGSWTLDSEAMKSSDDYKNATEEEKQMADMMFASMKMDLTFTKADVTMDADMMGMKQRETKPYKVKSQNGKTLVLTTKDEQGLDEDVTVIVATDTLTFKAGEDSFTMKRKK